MLNAWSKFIKTSFKTCFTITIFIIVSGCVSHIPPTYEIENPGYLLIGIGSNAQPYLHKVEFELIRLKSEANRKRASKKSIVRLCRQSRLGTCDPLDYKDDQASGAITIKGLSAGWYRLASVQVSTIMKHGGFDIIGRKDTNIDFEIIPGRTSYVGHYLIDQLTFSNLEKHRFKARFASINFSNQLSRDLQLGLKKFAALPDSVDLYQPNRTSIRRLKAIETPITRIEPNMKTILSDKNYTPPTINCGWWCEAE